MLYLEFNLLILHRNFLSLTLGLVKKGEKKQLLDKLITIPRPLNVQGSESKEGDTLISTP